MPVLQPIWLFAMAAVAVPLVIHLWNDRQGKTLPIGSVAFLDKRSRRQSRSPRISEWLLLVLRCLLLMVLALLLAGPFWRKPPVAAARGWVLLGDTTLAKGSYKGLIDSLLAAGYQRHTLGEDRVEPEGGREESTGEREESTGDREDATRKKNEKGAGANWWADLVRMDQRAPAGIPFFVFTDGRLVHFRGRRPSTDRAVHWYLAIDVAEAAVNRIAGAWASGADSMAVLTLSSRPTGSSYSYHTELRGGRKSLSQDSQTVAVDTAVLRVKIVTDNKYNNDGGYVAAAIRALQKFTRRNIRVGVNDSERADWVFWLSAEPLPAGLAADHVLIYQPGREIPVDTWIEGMDAGVSRIVAAEQAGRERPGHAEEQEAGMAVWKDGFGRALLRLEEQDGKKIFHFYSHFDPAWNGLVWSSRFPAAMASLLLDEGGFPGADFVKAGDDRRVLDPLQVQPGKKRGSWTDSLDGSYEDFSMDEGMPVKGGNGVEGIRAEGPPVSAGLGGNIDLAPACWLLAFLLLAAERYVSYRTSKKTADG